MTTSEKMYKLQSDNSRWLDSLESAYLTITNPKTGGIIQIKKVHMGGFTKEERKLVWSCYKTDIIRDRAWEFEVTLDQSNTLLRLSEFKY